MYSENSKDDDEYNKVETSDSKKGFDMLYSPMGPFLLHNFDYVKLWLSGAVPLCSKSVDKEICYALA